VGSIPPRRDAGHGRQRARAIRSAPPRVLVTALAALVIGPPNLTICDMRSASCCEHPTDTPGFGTLANRDLTYMPPRHICRLG
jgi:hypothetical protein